MMKALIVGLGSMGKRRARLLGTLGVQVIGVDSNESRAKEAGDLLTRAYKSIAEALLEAPDVAFVCTSPLSHHAIEKELLSAGLHVFTELNLVNGGYGELIAIAKEKNLIAFPSSTWLYRKEMEYITKKVKEKGGKCAYTYHIGQYLPDWHPWESYKDYFIGNAKTNGCREIMALELPWLVRAFGPIREVTSVSRRLTDLEITYPDTYMVQILHEGGAIGSLTVDITSPLPVRTFEAIGEGLQLFWEGRPDTLAEFNKETRKREAVALYDNVTRQEGYASFIIENAYLDEIKAFLGAVEGTVKPIYTLEDDAEILAVIDRIEGEAK